MQRSHIGAQFAWYLVVGGASTVVDVGGFVLLSAAGLPLVLASPTSFLLGTAFNYFASYTLAFTRGRFDRVPEMGRLLVVAGVGLLLNSAFVWLFVELGLLPVLAKVLAVPCVLAWNFLGRRWLVFHPDLPEATWGLTQRLAGADEATGTDREPREQ